MITRLKLSTIEQGLPKYRSMLAGNDAYIPTSFESIATATGTGSNATITFSSIPSTFQHLQVRYIARSTRTGDGSVPLTVRLNSDSGSNYAFHDLIGDGAAVTASGTASTTGYNIGRAVIRNDSTANCVGAGIIDILDYKSTTKNKTVRSFTGSDTNSTSGFWGLNLSSALWMNTSAVNTLTFVLGSDAFTTTSTFALYGIKG